MYFHHPLQLTRSAKNVYHAMVSTEVQAEPVVLHDTTEKSGSAKNVWVSEWVSSFLTAHQQKIGQKLQKVSHWNSSGNLPTKDTIWLRIYDRHRSTWLCCTGVFICISLIRTCVLSTATTGAKAVVCCICQPLHRHQSLAITTRRQSENYELRTA